MLTSTVLERVFLFKQDGQEIILSDPSDKLSVEAVLNFYANTYPILTTAKITGPEIKNDTVQYCFETVMGTKGENKYNGNKTNHQKNPHQQKTTRMATISKVQQPNRSFRQPARCSSRSTKQGKSRTARHHYNGFLKSVFAPVYALTETNWKKTEGELFYSLSNVCHLYGWDIPEVSGLDYPLNISAVFEQVNKKCMEQNLSCIITKSDKDIISITTVKVYNTGHTLYYIPVKPMWQLLQNKDRPLLSEIWKELFRYLYHINRVAYYREDSYLQRIYEILNEWISDETENEDEAYRKNQQETIDILQTGGDFVLSFLKQDFDVKHLQQLLRLHKESTYYENETEKIITDCLNLYKDYPNRSIMQGIVNTIINYEDEEIVYVDQYLSFFWSSNDSLYENFNELINSELMEMTCQQEPVSLQLFDKPQIREQHNFDFEIRFFDLLKNIIAALERQENILS